MGGLVGYSQNYPFSEKGIRYDIIEYYLKNNKDLTLERREQIMKEFSEEVMPPLRDKMKEAEAFFKSEYEKMLIERHNENNDSQTETQAVRQNEDCENDFYCEVAANDKLEPKCDKQCGECEFA